MGKPIHSPVGASSIHRVIACPGSVRLSRGLPDDCSFEAAEGTVAHELGAKGLEHVGWEPWHVTGETFKQEGQEITVDADMCAALETYIGFCNRLRNEHLGTAGCQVYTEFEVDMVDLHPDIYGRLDFAVTTPAVINMVDLKYGIGIVVEAPNNVQLMYYAACLVHKLAAAGREFDLTTPVRIIIVQPRAPHPEGPIRVWATTVRDVLNWVDDVLLPAITASEDPKAKIATGDHCRYCLARTRCPALNALAEEIADMEIMLGGDLLALSDQDLGDRLARFKPLTFLVKGMEDETYKRCMNGGEVPGFKLVPKRADRVWKPGTEIVLEEAYGAEMYAERKVCSPAQIAKKAGGKKIAKRYAYKPDTGLTLAPASDTRVAVRRSADEVFSDLPVPAD